MTRNDIESESHVDFPSYSRSCEYVGEIKGVTCGDCSSKHKGERIVSFIADLCVSCDCECS